MNNSVHSAVADSERVQGREAAGYYIASLKHTSNHHEHITFWAPNNNGYVLAMTDGHVGAYPLSAIGPDYLHDGVSTLAVPVEVVKALLSPEPYFRNGKGVAARFYDTPGPVVDNTRANWNHLLAAALPLPTGAKPKPQVFRGARRSFAITGAKP